MTKKEFKLLGDDWSTLQSGHRHTAYKNNGVIKAEAIEAPQQFQKFELETFDKPKSAKVELRQTADGKQVLFFRCDCGCETLVELVSG